VGTQHFLCWACHVFVVSCHLDRQPAFIWWAPGIMVATRHLFLWAAGISFGGHLAFWVPPGKFVGTRRFFLVGTWHFGDNLASCWAPSIYFDGHMAFWWVPSVSFVGLVALIVVGTQVFYRCAPGISLGGHGAFCRPPGILMGTRCYFW